MRNYVEVIADGKFVGFLPRIYWRRINRLKNLKGIELKDFTEDEMETEINNLKTK